MYSNGVGNILSHTGPLNQLFEGYGLCIVNHVHPFMITAFSSIILATSSMILLHVTKHKLSH